MNDTGNYPWYDLVNGEELIQGDVLESCPVLLPQTVPDASTQNPIVEWAMRDVIVLTQSCDLVVGREKVTEYCCAFRIFEATSLMVI